jgi:hypothetical protein
MRLQISMLRIPPRGDLPECWINPSHVVSVYYASNYLFIELPRKKLVSIYDSSNEASIAARSFVKLLADPNAIVTMPRAIGGDIVNV